MKYIDALIALAICLICIPSISAQYTKLCSSYRVSVACMHEIAGVRENINAISGRYQTGIPLALPDGFILQTVQDSAGNHRDALFFRFEGTERFWILGR